MLCLKGARPAGQAGVQSARLNPAQPLELPCYSRQEVRGMRVVAVKCIDITQNSDCEGSAPAPY